MQFILPYIERLPGIPDSYNVLVAQILSALVFLLLLALCAKVATWVSNRVFPKLISKLHAENGPRRFWNINSFRPSG